MINKFNKLCIIAMCLIAFSFELTSCTKDDSTLDNSINLSRPTKNDKIPHYRNLDEVLDIVTMVNSMDSIEQIYEYECQRGFLSFGLFYDMAFDTINFEQLAYDEEGIRDLCNKYWDILDTSWQNEELYVEPKYTQNLLRYAANKEGFLFIGDTLLRIFKNHTLATLSGNEDVLRSINPECPEFAVDDSLVFFFFTSSENATEGGPSIVVNNMDSQILSNHRGCLGFTSYTWPKGECNTGKVNNGSCNRKVRMRAVWDYVYGCADLQKWIHWVEYSVFQRCGLIYVGGRSSLNYYYNAHYHQFKRTAPGVNNWVNVHMNGGWHSLSKVHSHQQILYRDWSSASLGVVGVHYSNITIGIYASCSGTFIENNF